MGVQGNMWRIWNMLLFGGGIAAILLADPRQLHGEAVFGILMVVAVLANAAGLLLGPGRKDAAEAGLSPQEYSSQADPTGPKSPDSAGLIQSYVIPVLAALLLSVLYWYRGALDTGAMESSMRFRITEALLFWVPALAFIGLYRAPDEGFRVRRSVLLLRLLTGLIAGLLGMTGAAQIHKWYDARYDRTTLVDAMAHHKNHFLADDVTVTWSHSRPDLDVELSWPNH